MVSHNDSHMLKLLATIPAMGDVRRFMAFDQAYYLPDNLLAKVDRMLQIAVIRIAFARVVLTQLALKMKG